MTSDILYPPIRFDGLPGVNRPPVMVAYGCGLDSTGMVLGLIEKNMQPDAILFADTGGEKPETYKFLFTFDACLGRGTGRSRLSSSTR